MNLIKYLVDNKRFFIIKGNLTDDEQLDLISYVRLDSVKHLLKGFVIELGGYEYMRISKGNKIIDIWYYKKCVFLHNII